MYNRSRNLSHLAQGHGMVEVEGGVEVECFSDDSRAFSLGGQSFLTPSNSYSKKPYRAHKLNLPKTYITKRGQMVLFTAPEDMIIGQPCHVYHKETTCKLAARELRTTGNLTNSVLGYSSVNDLQQNKFDGNVTLPGHFTKVYLNSLQKATRQGNLCDMCQVEDIEEDKEYYTSEAPLSSECDSGLGQSIGKIIIPTASEEVSNSAMSNYKTTAVKPNTSLTSKPGKKRQRPNSTHPTSMDSPKSLKAKSPKNSLSTKTGKPKRRRSRKDANGRVSIHDSHDREDSNVQMSSSYEQDPTTIPGVEVQEVGGNKFSSGNFARKAEERRAEIERKREGKKELEALKRQELEEKYRLEREMAQQNSLMKDKLNSLITLELISEEVDTASSDRIPSEDFLPKQNKVIFDLEKSLLFQQAWSAEDIEANKVEKELTSESEAQEEPMRNTKELEEERINLEKLRELEDRLKQQKLEEAARNKAAEILSHKSSRDNIQRVTTDLSKQRESKQFSKSSLMFSYFNYVPPSKPKPKPNKNRGRIVKNKPIKAQ